MMQSKSTGPELSFAFTDGAALGSVRALGLSFPLPSQMVQWQCKSTGPELSFAFTYGAVAV